MEKHELSKIDFDIIEHAFKTLLQSRPDPVTAGKWQISGISFGTLTLVGWRLRKPHGQGQYRQAVTQVTAPVQITR